MSFEVVVDSSIRSNRNDKNRNSVNDGRHDKNDINNSWNSMSTTPVVTTTPSSSSRSSSFVTPQQQQRRGLLVLRTPETPPTTTPVKTTTTTTTMIHHNTPNTNTTTKSIKKSDQLLEQQGLIRNMNRYHRINHIAPATNTAPTTVLTPPPPQQQPLTKATPITKQSLQPHSQQHSDIVSGYMTPKRSNNNNTNNNGNIHPSSTTASPSLVPEHTSTTPTTNTVSPSMMRRTVYLIRHGESLGQMATSTHDRRTNPNLLDCGLSITGIQQAEGPLRHYFQHIPIDLILCSPLTRAIQTAILAFGGSTNHTTTTTTTTSVTATTTTKARNSHENDHGATPIGNTDTQPSSPTVTTPGAKVRRPDKILIHYHLREMGSDIPENQPRTLKQVRDYCLDQTILTSTQEWDALMDTTTLVPPPPPQRQLHLRSSTKSSSTIKLKRYHTNDNKDCNYNSTDDDDDDDDNNGHNRTENLSSSSALSSSRGTTTSTILGSWPYRNNCDTVPNVLRRDYIQYMLNWLASYCHSRDTTTTTTTTTDTINNDDIDRVTMNSTTATTGSIVIVCHYHVIRVALSCRGVTNNYNNNCRSGSRSNSNAQRNNNKTTFADGIRPQNAQPIKCYLCTVTGQLTLADL